MIHECVLMLGSFLSFPLLTTGFMPALVGCGIVYLLRKLLNEVE